MEILDVTTRPGFVSFHKMVPVLLFKVRNFKVSADKSKCIKNQLFDFMHTKFHGPEACTSWLGSYLDLSF